MEGARLRVQPQTPAAEGWMASLQPLRACAASTAASLEDFALNHIDPHPGISVHLIFAMGRRHRIPDISLVPHSTTAKLTH